MFKLDKSPHGMMCLSIKDPCFVTFDDAMAAIVEWVSKRWTTAATT